MLFRSWRWQRDTLCILKTENDRRSFAAGLPIAAELLLSHFGNEPLRDAQLTVTMDWPENKTGAPRGPGPMRCSVAQEVGTLQKALDLEFRAPPVSRPTRLTIRTELRDRHGTWFNEWPIWVVPRPARERPPGVALHDSFPSELAESQFPHAPKFAAGKTDAVVLTSRLDDDLMDHLEAGGRVLLLANGQKGSFPLADH